MAERVNSLADDRRQIMADALAAEDRTRARISQLRHDELLQTLLTARQDLAAASTSADAHRDSVIQASETVAQAIEELRCAVAALHPATLTHGGLRAALRAIADIHARRDGFEVTLDLAADADGRHDQLIVSLTRELLSNIAQHADARRGTIALHLADVEILFEVADDGGLRAQLIVSLTQELLSNAARHAHATHVTSTLRHSRQGIVFEVADDGLGTDPSHRGKRCAKNTWAWSRSRCGSRRWADRFGSPPPLARAPASAA